MSQKKRHGQNPRVSAAKKPLIRLSQCMIVKDEEKNIERALSWGKDIVCEQIVVDTGSTDRTVEIAERMGAKVFHFKWIDDFAAAKNYAIEQATGNWIAFLDADEFFLPEDAVKLWKILNDPAFYQRYHVLRCSLVNLNDQNKVHSVYVHERVFRKLPDIRYRGRIHERLSVYDKILVNEELRIMHTGYARSAYAEKKKEERNLTMLRREQEANPDDPTLMLYIADSLSISPDDTGKRSEAEELYLKALNSGKALPPQLEQKAYDRLIPKFADDPDRLAEAESMCLRAMERFPQNLDFMYYYACLLRVREDYAGAWKMLKKCEDMLNAEHIPQSTVVVGSPILLFTEMAQAAQKLEKQAETIHYATLILREDNSRKGVLLPYLNILRDGGVTDDELLGLLGRLYNLESLKDKLFLLRAAKESGSRSLAERLMEKITPEEREWLSGGGE